MKASIHPQQFEVKVTCSSCGNTFTTLSTKQEIHVEVCHKCHPFFTGEHRFIDTKGRVEDFQRKQQAAATLREQHVARKERKERGEYQPKSLKELLGEA